jgi:hypothetical protein
MPSYKAEITLPSCQVDLSLLEAIEKWLNSQLPESIPGIVKSAEKPTLEVSIEDALGTEVFASVSDISYPIFLVSTKDIRISWRSPYSAPTRLHIALRFERGNLRHSKLTMDLMGKRHGKPQS